MVYLVILFFAYSCNGGIGTNRTNELSDSLVVSDDYLVASSEELAVTRDDVVSTFVDEIGVVEGLLDNTGERIEEYLAVTGLGPGYAWCAAFVSWGFNEHDIVSPLSAWSPDWFPDSAVVYTRGVHDYFVGEPADVIGIWFSSKNRIAHVGVIEDVSDSYVFTIEGNTNDADSREGDRVMRKKRFKRQIYSVSSWLGE